MQVIGFADVDAEVRRMARGTGTAHIEHCKEAVLEMNRVHCSGRCLRLRKGEDDSRKILIDAFFFRNDPSVSGLCIGGVTIESWTAAQVVPIVRFNNGLERFMFPEAFEMTITNVGTCFRVQVSQSCAVSHRNHYVSIELKVFCAVHQNDRSLAPIQVQRATEIQPFFFLLLKNLRVGRSKIS
jgi:hypothetical protein